MDRCDLQNSIRSALPVLHKDISREKKIHFKLSEYCKRKAENFLTWGVSSTSNSPDKYCRSNSAFSPTFEEIMRFICLVWSRRPRPKLSTLEGRNTSSFRSKARLAEHGHRLPSKPRHCAHLKGSYRQGIAPPTGRYWVTFPILQLRKLKLEIFKWLFPQQHGERHSQYSSPHPSYDCTPPLSFFPLLQSDPGLEDEQRWTGLALCCRGNASVPPCPDPKGRCGWRTSFCPRMGPGHSLI